MIADERRPRATVIHETPEEAKAAIESALEFLRNEAAALGMREVSALLAQARRSIRGGSVRGGSK